MWKLRGSIAVVAILAVAILQDADAVCNVCNSNGAACTSNNTFQLCFNNQPLRDVTYRCPLPRQVCTQFASICIDTTTAVNVRPGCGDTSKCGQCSGKPSGTFTCTSRTTFTMCSNNVLTDIRSNCPQGQLCYSSLADAGRIPCSASCNLDKNELCDLDWPIDAPGTPPTQTPPTQTPPTQRPPTQTPPTQLPPTQPNIFCAAQNAAGRYAYPGDTRCTDYINCFWRNGRLEGTALKCPNGLYFNANIRNCQIGRPFGCI